MTPEQAAQVLGVRRDQPWDEVRAVYRRQMRTHHPDRTGGRSSARAAEITEAYRVLADEREQPTAESEAPGRPPAGRAPTTGRVPPRPAPPPPSRAPAVHRLDADTLLLDAPADEAFRWLLDAAHDIGEITYVDRSMPIMEVLCRFEGEPATSLLVTLQGRGRGTEVFCTVESIEARPAPPTSAVVDLMELALHRRRTGDARPG